MPLSNATDIGPDNLFSPEAYIPGHYKPVCRLCGAVVGNEGLHRQWHFPNLQES